MIEKFQKDFRKFRKDREKIVDGLDIFVLMYLLPSEVKQGFDMIEVSKGLL